VEDLTKVPDIHLKLIIKFIKKAVFKFRIISTELTLERRSVSVLYKDSVRTAL
jgi:hypothetical protein